MEDWLEFGHREGLHYRVLAQKAGVHPRTVMRWQQRFRAEAALRKTPDHDEQAFVQLAESVQAADPRLCRIEIVVPGEHRVVVQGDELVKMLARLVRWHRLC